MAILYGNTVWEGLSTEPKPNDLMGGFDGHIFKEMDTGESYIRRYGIWEHINLGLAFVKATKSGRVTTDANGFYHITFNTPFINNEYTVVLSVKDMGSVKPAMVFYDNIKADGFDIQTRDSKKGEPFGDIKVSWLATRDYNP